MYLPFNLFIYSFVCFFISLFLSLSLSLSFFLSFFIYLFIYVISVKNGITRVYKTNIVTGAITFLSICYHSAYN